ncbi:MAG: tetratricopeptide repeat protein [Planctomycetota bacterium]
MTRKLVALLALAAILAVAAVWWARRPRPLPDPPRLEDAAIDVDPAAKAIIDQMVEASLAAPASAAHRARLAMVYQANRLGRLAAETYEQALDAAPNEARWWYNLATVYRERGATDEAMAAMSRAARLEPDYAPARWWPGYWLLERGELDEAEAAFRTALAVEPGGGAGSVGLVRVLLQQGRPEEALEILEPLARTAYVHHLLAAALRQAGRVDEAVVHAAQASPNPPTWIDPWRAEVDMYRRSIAGVLELADALIAVGSFDAALQQLETLRRTRPRDPVVLAKIGEVQMRAGRLDQARDALDRALVQDPGYAPAHLFLSQIHLRRGDRELALRHAGSCVRLNGTWGPAHLQLAAVHLSPPQRWSEAEAALRLAIRYGVADTETRINLALTLFQQSKLDESAGVLAELLAQRPYEFKALVVGVVIYSDRGDLDGAQTLLARAQTLRPDDQQVREAAAHLEKRRQETGR